MNATYCVITELEMDSVLKSEKGWIKSEFGYNVKEVVYEFQINPKLPIWIKVFSSIKRNNGLSRGCGEDAIRVCAVNKETNKGIRKVGRINRVPNWQERLKVKVIEMIKDIRGK